MYFYVGRDYFYDGRNYLDKDVIHTFVPLTLVTKRLDCNPSLPLTQCALSEILSWVSELVNYEYKFNEW